MKANDVKQIAAALRGEAASAAHRVAVSLFGQVPVDGQKLSKRAFLEMVSRQWQDPNYRAALRVRIGDEAFLNAAEQAGCIPPGWPDLVKQMEASNVAA
ncbi:MAG: hypothetical protein ACRDU0_14790 [Mycobacterium sp.]